MAWRPENDQEKLPKFRNVKISVVGKPGMTVRAPKGYVAGPQPSVAATAAPKDSKPKTPEAELRDALSDFYPAGGLPTLLSLIGRLGSAIQWIVIPDLTKKDLTLSSVLLGGQLIEDKSVQLSVDHIFPRVSQLGYWVFVYNAKRDENGKPQITVQTQVLRDGQTVLNSPQRTLSNTGPDFERIPFGEELALKTLSPGKYDLKVIVIDRVAGTTASQIADFIVR